MSDNVFDVKMTNSETIDLLVKTGYFFAGIDGCIDNAETDLITVFVKKMSIEYPEFTDVEKLSGYKSANIEFESLMNEFDSYLEHFDMEDRKRLIDSFNGFIEAVINADGIIHPSESEYYLKWKKHLLPSM